MKNHKITIIDYGVGNIQSLKKAFEFLGSSAFVSEEANEILSSDAVVLPGVGSFEAGMRGLKTRGITETVRTFADSGRPMLGICLGAQLMLDKGYEFGEFRGLGIIPGVVSHFPELDSREKVPQVGWNRILRPEDASWEGSILDCPDYENLYAYFVHSYIMAPENPQHVFGTTSYGGIEFCSAMRRGSIFGVQFHPEKSGKVGLAIINNFVKLIK